jgi:hypothetical protein
VKFGLSQDGGTLLQLYVIFTLTLPCFKFTLMILNSILARIKHVLHYKDQRVKSENDTEVVIHWEKCVCLLLLVARVVTAVFYIVYCSSVAAQL